MHAKAVLALLILTALQAGLLPLGRVAIAAQQGSTPRILFDESHSPFEWTIGGGKVAFTLEDGFSSLATNLRSVGFEVDAIKSAPIALRDLEGASILVIPPSNGKLSSVDMNAIVDFVRAGGGLLLLGENSYTEDASLAAMFGIARVNAVVCDPANSLPIRPFHIRIWNMTDHDVTKDVSSYIFDWGQPLVASPPAVALAYVGNESWTETDYDGVRQSGEDGKNLAVLAAAEFGSGRVVAAGDTGGLMNYDPIDWNGLDQFDTRRFALNIFNWLARQNLFGPSVSYDVSVNLQSAQKHSAHVKVEVNSLHTSLVTLTMFRWHDGEYYQMPITGFMASDATGRTLNYEFAIQSLKRSWTIQVGNATSLTFEYDVTLNFIRKDFNQYAGYLSQKSGISEGAGVFILPQDIPISKFTVSFDLPQGWAAYAPWSKTPDGAFIPENTKSLMWSTFAVGAFAESSKRVGNTNVIIAIRSDFPAPTQRLLADYSFRAYEYVSEVFGQSAPLGTYVTLWVPAAEDGRGICELEWSSSQGIVTDLQPNVNYNEYVHRVFHTWNAFEPTGIAYDSGEELWFIEGTNTYYDDKAVVELGLKNDLTVMASYLNEYFSQYLGTQFDVPLSDAYKYAGSGNFNMYNWLYYHKGALVSYLLDEAILNVTRGNRSFDDLLSAVYARYGGYRGAVSNSDLVQMLGSITGFNFNPFFQKFIFGTERLPLKIQGGGIAIDWDQLSRILNLPNQTITWSLATRAQITQSSSSQTGPVTQVSIASSTMTGPLSQRMISTASSAADQVIGVVWPNAILLAAAAVVLAILAILIIVKKRRTGSG